LSFTWNNVPYTLSSSVPEPATLSLLALGLGLAGMGSMRRRKILSATTIRGSRRRTG
jgi:hypothetical protein